MVTLIEPPVEVQQAATPTGTEAAVTQTGGQAAADTRTGHPDNASRDSVSYEHAGTLETQLNANPLDQGEHAARLSVPAEIARREDQLPPSRRPEARSMRAPTNATPAGRLNSMQS